MAAPVKPEKREWQILFSRTLLSFEQLVTTYGFWWVVCLLWAAMAAWSSRNAMNPDGMSYVDMASESLQGGAQHLVNNYWSPAYPALLSLAFLVFRPSPSLEFPVAHVVNFFVFAAVLLSFTFFLRSSFPIGRGSTVRPTDPLAIPFGFGIFLWFMLEFIRLSMVTPDLCVAGVIFLVAGICCRIVHLDAKWIYFAALGVALGLGYYIKAAVLPLGLLLLALLLVWPPGDRSRIKVLFAVAAMLLVAGPWIAVMSSRAGHLTIGETGRLNYAWHVNGLQNYSGWTGDNEYGWSENPPRTLLERPKLLEFAEPIRGTYPLWYDPVYWNAGAKARFNLRQQLAAFVTNARVYLQAFTQMSSLLAGALVFCALALPGKKGAIFYGEYRWLLAWPILACLMYAAIHAEYRFVGAFFVLFWVSLYRGLWTEVPYVTRAAVVATVLGTLLLPDAAKLFAGSESSEINHLQIAAALQARGVSRGDRLASVGQSFENYYARLTGTRIVAEFPDSNEFWRLSAHDMTHVKERLRNIGVKALVAMDRPAGVPEDAWQDVADSPRVSILPLADSVR